MAPLLERSAHRAYTRFVAHGMGQIGLARAFAFVKLGERLTVRLEADHLRVAALEKRGVWRRAVDRIGADIDDL